MLLHPFLASIASSIVVKLLELLAKKGFSKLGKSHPIKLAVSRTVSEFKKIEDLVNTLETWLQSEVTQKELKDFAKGKRNIDIRTLSKTLVKKTDFYYGDKSTQKGKEIIECFFSILNEEYLKSEEGLIHFSLREEETTKKSFEEHKKTQKGIEKIDTDISEIKTLLSQTAQADKWKGKYEDQFTKRIDEAKDLLNQGKAETAKKLYEKLLKDISQEKDISPEIRFRIYTNLACCEWELGLEKEAARHFELAHKLLPKDGKSLSNMAIAQVLHGKPEDGLKYVERVLDEDPSNIHGVCVKANLLTALKQYGEAITLFKHKDRKGFNRKLLENAQCSFTLGYVFYRKGDYKNAKEFFKKSTKIDPSVPDYFLLLGLSFFIPNILKKSLPWLIPGDVRKDLEKAKAYFSRALELLKDSESIPKKGSILVNRSAIRIALDDFDGSINDCKKAISIDSNNSVAYRNKGIAEFQKKKIEEAINSWSDAISKGEKPADIVSLIANAYLSKKPCSPNKAIKIIKKYFPDEEINEENLVVKLTLTECYIAQKEYVKAEKLIKKIQKSFPNNPRVLSAFAKYYMEKGEAKESESFFLKAIQNADKLDKQLISLELANYYFEQKFYNKAIVFYKKVINSNINNNALRNYLISLYNSSDKRKAHSECLAICRKIRKKYGITKLVSEIEAAIQETLGNLKQASELYSKLSRIEPEKYIHKLRYGVCEFRIGNQNKAVKILSKIKDKIKDDATALMTIAEIFDFVGKRRDSIVIGYKALKAAPNNPKIHLSYIRIFLSRDEDEWLEPAEIMKDTWVKLKVNGKENSYILIEFNETEEGEISIKSDLGMKLLGHKVGDVIKIRKTQLAVQKIKILEIKNKYVEAFQNTIENFNIRFLEERGLLQIKVGKNLKNIFKMLDENAKRVSQVTDFYKQRRFPVGTVSHLLGRTLFDCWEGLIGTPDLSLRCATGTVEEQKKEAELAKSTSDVIADSIGLFTLTHLDCLNVLPKLFKNIYVAQSTLDEITQCISALELGKKRGRTTIGKYKDRYRRWEVFPKAVQKEIDFLKKVKDFIINQSEVTGFKSPLSSSDKRLRKMIGEATLDSLVIAKENTLSLYSDDKSLRDLASAEYGIRGFCISALLSKALDQNIISKNEYNKAVVTLILSRYTFVPVNGEVLHFSANKSNFDSTSKETALLLQTMESPNTRLDSTINVLSDFIKLIWLEPILDNRKLSYLDLSLKTLTKIRGIRNVLDKFKKYIQIKLRYAPIHSDEILKNIDVWLRGKLLIY